MKTALVYFSIYFAFYILGAYATTDILRLLKGSTLSVNARDCYCPICHNRILLKDQIPLFSYLKNKGKCRHCGSKIPLSDLFLEFFLFFTLSVTATVFHFSWTGYFLCLIIYEGTKFLFLLLFKKREIAFGKNLAISLLHNIILFALLAFLFAITAFC